MSIFLRAIAEIAHLKDKADVHGSLRISISCDNDADKARLKHELKRDLNNSIAYGYNTVMNVSEMKINGIDVRIL